MRMSSLEYSGGIIIIIIILVYFDIFSSEWFKENGLFKIFCILFIVSFIRAAIWTPTHTQKKVHILKCS